MLLRLTISASGATKKAAAPAKAEKPAEEAAPAMVNLKSMKKAELVQYAADNNIELDPKATNAEMIAAIEAALK